MQTGAVTKTNLMEIAGLTHSALARLSENEKVGLKVLSRICKELDCNFSDIIEYAKD